MFTFIITLLLPLVSIGIWRQSILKNNKKSGQSVTIGKGEYVLRYLTCLLCMLVIPWILLSLTGNDGNTILRKLLESREYAVKVLCPVSYTHLRAHETKDAGLCHCGIVRGRSESRKA